MLYLFALLPILIVIVLMLALRWGGQKAGPVGWLSGLVIASAAFGLNWNVFWVSQVKGLLLTLNVLLILWTALFLYHLVDQIGGISAVAQRLGISIGDAGWLQIVLAWALSATVEGLAGFGLPMAIVAPMLVRLGVHPISAVAACAIGHAWAGTFGNMGVVLQMLASVVQLDPQQIVPAAVPLMGAACIGCGFGVAVVLGKLMYWRRVLVLGFIMAGIQGITAWVGLEGMGSLFAAVTGIGVGIVLGKGETGSQSDAETARRLRGALAAYGLLAAMMIVTSLFPNLRAVLTRVVWQMNFPEVTSRLGVVTAAGPGQIFRPLVHPAFLITMVSIAAYGLFMRLGLGRDGIWSGALDRTFRSASPVTVGVISMVGLSTIMDHTGMTLLLAQGLARISGAAFPFFSPLIGMLGSFATGSNSNSNVLFGPMQKNVALVLGIDAPALLAGQTSGGSLGSMIAPAKLIVGCTTTGLVGQDGLVLRKTLPVGLSLGLMLGFVLLVLLALQ